MEIGPVVSSRKLQDRMRTLDVHPKDRVNERRKSQELCEGRTMAGVKLKSGLTLAAPDTESAPLDILDVYEYDFSNDETWLYTNPQSPQKERNKVEDIYKWLYKGYEDPNNTEVHLRRRGLVNRLDNMQKSICDQEIANSTFCIEQVVDSEPSLSPKITTRKWDPLEAWEASCDNASNSTPQKKESTNFSRLNASLLQQRSSGIPHMAFAFGEGREESEPLATCSQEGVESPSGRHVIDTRTFTRSKRRKLPILNSLEESNDVENSETQLNHPQQHSPERVSCPTTAAPHNLNATFDLGTTCEPSPRNTKPVKTTLNDTFSITCEEETTREIPGYNDSIVQTVVKKQSQPLIKREGGESGKRLGVLRKLSYTIERTEAIGREKDGGVVRDNSEEDQLSSASDSSFSHRHMDLDDVQVMARMQEESLKKSSTPVSTYKKVSEAASMEKIPFTISPINKASEEGADYYSDNPECHSEDSSSSRIAVLRPKTPSLEDSGSMHSSPPDSPYSSQSLSKPSKLSLLSARGAVNSVMKSGIHKSMPNLASRIPNGIPQSRSGVVVRQQQQQPRLQQHVNSKQIPQAGTVRRGLQLPRVYGSGLPRGGGYGLGTGAMARDRRATSAQPPLQRPGIRNPPAPNSARNLPREAQEVANSTFSIPPQASSGREPSSKAAGGEAVSGVSAPSGVARGIPRPTQSKLPAPRGRSGLPVPGSRMMTYSKPKPSSNWMEGCY